MEDCRQLHLVSVGRVLLSRADLCPAGEVHILPDGHGKCHSVADRCLSQENAVEFHSVV
jgi:hypothetical protein